MLRSIRQLWSSKEERPLPAVPAGERVYAIGDIHGRLDLLTALSRAIELDDEARGESDTTIVLLGDLIDRGPESKGVLSFARAWRNRRNVRLLCGNHEEMFLRSFYDLGVFRNFLLYGGRETLQSYGIDFSTFDTGTMIEAQERMIDTVSMDEISFIEGFEDYAVIGNYMFVHAGIEPGTPLDEQDANVMRWIREPFLSHAGYHEHVVVHGHTIAAEPEIGQNRIGLDTGAYMSGRLTALGLERDRRWLLEAEDVDGEITVASRVV